jgi:hypothetical protein
MKIKYFIIVIIFGLLSFSVYLMLRMDTGVSQNHNIELIVENRNEVLLEDIGIEYLKEKALKSTYHFIADGDYFSILKNHQLTEGTPNQWEEIFIKGVNMGVALPGKFPSEFAATYEEYLHWFKLIGKMNSNTIRTYTILPPEFYKALGWYNLHFENKKLYLLQGVWAKEPPEDNYANAVYTKDFMREIKDVIDVIHGNAVLPHKRGHASGIYSYDISQYTIGIILGREWEPYAVTKTNRNDSINIPYGLFINVNNPNPMEQWLAGIMEFTARYETQTYMCQRPLSFVNWLPLDPMYHNSEFIESEDVKEFDNDLESVDMEKFSSTEYFKPGVFASYHVYPYYPDFIFQEEKYVNTKNKYGQIDNYLAYLYDLKRHQAGMPLIIAEYGVPSSRGNSHYTPFGYHQGGYSELEQAKISVLMTENIHQSRCAGALYFAWIDEWFKNNWLVMDFETPQESRKNWHNMENPEQNYGIIALENRKIEIDGSPTDWSRSLENEFIVADYDASYLYLAGNFKHISFDKHNLYIAIDTYDKNKGSFALPFKHPALKRGIEFLVEIKDTNKAQLLIDHNYAVYTDRAKGIIPTYRSIKNHDGIFVEQHLLANRERTNIFGDTFPEVKHNRGILQFGKSNNPQSSNANIYWTNNGFIEMRFPWQILNITDPSSMYVLNGDPITNHIDIDKTEGIHFTFILTNKNNEIIHMYPNNETLFFTWEPWTEPDYSFRIKPLYYALAKTFKNLTPKAPENNPHISDKHKFHITGFQGGKKGAVSIVMDGKCFSQYLNTLSLLEKYNINASFSTSEYTSIKSGATQYRKMLNEEFNQIAKLKHEIRSNGFHYPTNTIDVQPWKESHEYILIENDTSYSIRNIYNILTENVDSWSILLIRHIYDTNSREFENLIRFTDQNVSNITPIHFEKIIRISRNINYWIAPVKHISEYLHIRDNSTLKQTQINNTYLISINNKLPQSQNNHRITLLYQGPAKMVYIDSGPSSGTHIVRRGELFFEIIPNQQISFEIIQ